MSDRSLVKARLTQGVMANVIGRPAQLVLELLASVLVARYLGPELLATLVAIRALANLAGSVGDFGITNTLSKLVPDLSASHGAAEALRVARDLTILRLVAVPLVGLAGYGLAHAGFVELGDIELSGVMVAASIVLAIVTVVNGSRRYVIVAALRLRDILVVDLLAAVVGPAVNIAAAVLTRDPLVVALSSIATQLVVFVALHFALSYDLDSAAIAPGSTPAWKVLVSRYGPFAAMAYAKYVFNRVVLRNPMLLFVLGVLGASSAEIGNAAIALSLTFQAWEIADIPLAQMRGPVLARFHARRDRAGMEKLEAVSVSIITITSCLLATVAMAAAEPVIATVYGAAYADAAHWAAIACSIGLLANVSCLGNTTLQQLENYRAQVASMAIAVLSMAAGLVVLLRMDLGLEPALGALTLIVVGRALFWLMTDLWADRSVFAWGHSATKARGVLAALPSLALAAWIDASTLAGGIGAAIVVAAVFLATFRILGGVGARTRALVSDLLPQRLGGVARLI
jgi:O-antigen/teichoic acid export membrane protein